MSKQIFIGGTGRSGTSILYQALGTHKEIHTFPLEMRFIIDHNGIMNLVDALTTRYSTVQAREALFSFEKLMRHHLVFPYRAPYVGYNLPAWLGRNFYRRRLDQFCKQLVHCSYEGTDYPVEENSEFHQLFPLIRRGEKLKNLPKRIINKILKQPSKNTAKPFWPEREMKVVKYFSDRRELCSLAAEFIDDLFVNAAKKHGKSVWCEKTPLNILHIDFLWEVFPKSYFIHIKRDPRGVAQSLARQFWGPQNIRDACYWLKETYERWFDLRKRLDLKNGHYLEIQLEELAKDPEKGFEEISNFCRLEDSFSKPPVISEDKVYYWKKAFSPEEKKVVNSILGEFVEKMGYELKLT